MFTTINQYTVCRAMLDYDGLKIDPEELYDDWNWCKRVAVPHASTWRQVKSDIIHSIPYMEQVRTTEYTKIRNELERMKCKYGERSITFNTLVRAVSLAELTVQQVNDIKAQDTSLPPAFDPNMVAPKTEAREELREEIENWLKENSNLFLNILKNEIRRYIRSMTKIPETYTILTNGTTTGIEWHGININDILGVVFMPEHFLEQNPWYRRLAKFFKSHAGHPDVIYIEIPECDIYKTGGEHMYIPDKDGKIREVYRMYPWIQVVSKAIHRLLDKVAKNLPGNYTYKHKSWLEWLMQNPKEIDKYIVGADMEKYSDTLERSFILQVLKECGVPTEIVLDMDHLYGMDIWEGLHSRVLTGLQSSLQGQYGDFPLITIANLTTQAFIYHKLNEPQDFHSNAAVGDDTGMKFSKYEPYIMELITETYGCIGVNINQTKTSELINSEGVIDFVKLQLDKEGIRPFLNMRSICKNNIDSVIRDISELYCSDEKKYRLLKNIFGDKEGERIINTSIINGGLRKGPITKEDIYMYHEQSTRIMSIMEPHIDETGRGLEEIQRYLKEDYPDGEEHYLCETLLAGWLSEQELLDDSYSLSDLDERIKMNILNALTMGLNKGQCRHYSKWIGEDPEDLRSEWKKTDRDPTKNQDKAELWDEISSFDTMLSRRENKHKMERSKSSYMLPILNGLWEDSMGAEIPESQYIPQLCASTLNDYLQKIGPYKAYRNTMKYKQLLEGEAEFVTEHYFGNCYRYVFCEGDGMHRKQYRLYDVNTYSLYPKLPKEIFQKWKEGPLRGIDVNYDEFITHFLIQNKRVWNMVVKEMERVSHL